MYDMVRVDTKVFEIVIMGRGGLLSPHPPIVSCLKYPGSDRVEEFKNYIMIFKQFSNLLQILFKLKGVLAESLHNFYLTKKRIFFRAIAHLKHVAKTIIQTVKHHIWSHQNLSPNVTLWIRPSSDLQLCLMDIVWIACCMASSVYR